MSTQPDPERDTPTSNGASPPNLIKFRDMVGINTPSSLLIANPPRPAQNIGIYARVVSEERKTQYQYYLMASVINAAFLGQIIVAAALTALSAASVSHIIITVLGSVNTVIAGIQTYLKGQGLPNRLKQYQFGLRKLREYIEDRERDFSREDCKLDVDFVVSDVVAMYQAVRQTAEDNTPDTYLPMGGAGKKLLGQKDDRATGAENTGLGTGGTVADAGSSAAAGNGGVEEGTGGEGPPASKSGIAADTTGTPSEHVSETEDSPLLKKSDKKPAA